MSASSLFSRLTILGISTLWAVFAGSAAWAAEPMSAAEAAAVVTPEQDPASSIEDETPIADAPLADALARLRRDVQSLERHLRLRLLEVADASSAGRLAATRSADEVDRLRTDLRFLEEGLHSLSGDSGATEVTTLIRKVRALEPLVYNLERALEHPEAAASGLAELRRALEVEWPPAVALQGTVNDACADAIPIGDGTFFGNTQEATPDGEGCFSGSPDVWFAYTAPATTAIVADTFGSGFDTVLSMYTGCPGTFDNEVACNDDTFGTQSAIRFQAQAGETYLLRVAGCCGLGGSVGPFTLNVGPGGAIAGTVTAAATGDPLPSIQLEVYNSESFSVGAAVTDSEGNYEISGLNRGDHFVFTRDAQGYLREVYDDLACDVNYGCSPLSGTPIAVVSGETTGGIDFELRRGGTLEGTVTERATGNPPSNGSVRVYLYNLSGNFVADTFTDSTGHYQFSGLVAGDYLAITNDSEYVDQLYDDVACPGGLFSGCQPEDGQPIAVDFGTTTGGIDFALDRLGAISGSLVDAITGFPISSGSMRAWNDRGEWMATVGIDSAGTYTVGGLLAGTYFITSGAHEYFDELYDDLPCEPECDPTVGTPIEVRLNQTTPDIDFELIRLGGIAGTVVDRATGDPLQGARVIAWNELGNTAGSSSVSSTGAFLLEDLAPGNYKVTVRDENHQGELYDDIPCPDGECDLTPGMPIAVELNSITGGIEFELERLGSISGRVTHTLTGEPLANIEIAVFDTTGYEVGGYGNRTNESGRYTVEGLKPGDHFVVTRDSDYLDKLYDDLLCEGSCDPTRGTPIPTDLNTVTEGIDFALDRLGEIRGRVLSSQTGQPPSGVFVRLFDDEGRSLDSEFVSFSGEYSFRGVEPGTYFLIAGDYEFAAELYEEIPCVTGCDPTTGTPVSADLNSVTSGIDFTLDRLGAISGRVTHNGQPVNDGEVFLYNSAGNLQDGAFTDFDGRYQLENLLPGLYFAIAVHSQHDDVLYDGIPCEGGCDSTAGTPIAVTVNATTSGINFALDSVGSIAGRVTYAGQPLTDARVAIYDSVGLAQIRVATDAAGEYLAEGLEVGTYFAVAEHPQLDDELYDNLPCDDGCDPTAGAPIVVGPGSITGGIDFALGYCTPTATSLCLTGDRFRVDATWTDFESNMGLGQAEQLTADSGYFWFFNASNIELVVKVLDACNQASNHFWVFGAGLTDVGVELTITDGLTGEVRPYSNPLGTKYAPITDTSAFPTCDAGRVEPATAVVPAPEAKLAEPKRVEVAEAWVAEVAGSGALKMDCVPGETGLCLNEGRFLVEAQWQTREGNAGSAQAIPLTGDTGYFWFFSPDNVEVMVKVLDACELDGFNNFWVFAAGLTDVEVTLTVTDTASGEVQEYFNPLGTPFEAITDTGAFDTCDS